MPTWATIRSGVKGGGGRASSSWAAIRGAQGNQYARQLTNKQRKLAAAGLLDEFGQYKEGPGIAGKTWKAIRSLGSNVMDVVLRPEYAMSAMMEGGFKQQPMGERLKAAGRELASGIGGIKGKKTSIPETLSEYVPQYEQFQETHPIGSILTDLALSVGLDPTTYIPGAVFAKGAKKAGRGLGIVTKPIRGTTAYQSVAGKLGRTFDTAYLWKKAGATKGYDIVWSQDKFADYMRHQYGDRLKPVVEELTDMTNDQLRNYVRKMYEPELLFDNRVNDVADVTRSFMREVGEKDFTEIGKKFSGLIDGYFPNNPKLYTDLIKKRGTRVATGHARGMQATRATFEKAKKLKTADELFQWWDDIGIADDDLAEVISRNLVGRTEESVSKIRTLRTHKRLLEELPDIFRKLEPGTTQVWHEGVQAGESLWMPAGNLRFFAQSKWDSLPKPVKELLEEGGELTDELRAMLDKELVGVTTRVPVYAVPEEIVEDLTRISRSLGKDIPAREYWDQMLGIFKNTAIFSPFFHMRNFISSSSQNYLAGMNIKRQMDALGVFKAIQAGDTSRVILGMTAGEWDNLARQYGVLSGSFVGQQVGKTGIPGVEPLFKFNRKVGTSVENAVRLPLFMDSIQKGMSPLDAAKRVKKFHFDYGELTNTEREVFKRFIPFYGWTRKNVPLQLEMIFKAPKKYRNIAKLKGAVSGYQMDEDQPEWWKEQDVWSTKLESGQGDKLGFMAGLPYSDLNQVLANPTGFLGPAGTAYNIATNYNPFRRGPIKEFPGQETPVPIPGTDIEIGIDPTLKYAVESLAPVTKRYGFDLAKEVNDYVSGDPQAQSEAKYRLLAKVIGFRLLPNVRTKTERNKVFKTLEQIKNFEKYHNQQMGVTP